MLLTSTIFLRYISLLGNAKCVNAFNTAIMAWQRVVNEVVNVKETKFKIGQFINDGWVITFQWMPCHCNIPGN